jgi:hypothetical protein
MAGNVTQRTGQAKFFAYPEMRLRPLVKDSGVIPPQSELSVFRPREIRGMPARMNFEKKLQNSQ